MKLIFFFPEDEKLATALSQKSKIELGLTEIRDFPDGEFYIRIISDVKDKNIFVVCRLDRPNNKILSLLFIAKTLKELGAKKIFLISPYLPYMRQDKRFKSGEVISSVVFAKFISSFIDQLITIDPHLHRIKNLSEIFSIPIATLHMTQAISEWIQKNVANPHLIGPDEESAQWVNTIANKLNTPFSIIKKNRHGDRDVTISISDMPSKNRTPVLIDDIISTGTTMLAAIHEFISKGLHQPICIGVHGLFDERTHAALLSKGAKKIVTSNSILNAYDEIDITDIIAETIKNVK